MTTITSFFKKNFSKPRKEDEVVWMPETILPIEDLILRIMVFRRYIKYLNTLSFISKEEIDLNHKTYIVMRQELRLRLRLLRHMADSSFEESLLLSLDEGGLGRGKDIPNGNGERRGPDSSGEGITTEPAD